MSNVQASVLDVPSFADTAPIVEPPVISGELCDSCGGGIASVASFVAYKGSEKLYFCKHHVRKHQEGLLAKGFKLNPEDTAL